MDATIHILPLHQFVYPTLVFKLKVYNTLEIFKTMYNNTIVDMELEI